MSLYKTRILPSVEWWLQHSPVYTLGKRGQDKDFLITEEDLRQKGAEIFRVSRGGETTFHGPGQLVAYPIVNLRRLEKGARAYVEALEDTVVKTLEKFGVKAQVQTLFSSLLITPHSDKDIFPGRTIW